VVRTLNGRKGKAELLVIRDFSSTENAPLDSLQIDNEHKIMSANKIFLNGLLLEVGCPEEGQGDPASNGSSDIAAGASSGVSLSSKISQLFPEEWGWTVALGRGPMAEAFEAPKGSSSGRCITCLNGEAGMWSVEVQQVRARFIPKLGPDQLDHLLSSPPHIKTRAVVPV